MLSSSSSSSSSIAAPSTQQPQPPPQQPPQQQPPQQQQSSHNYEVRSILDTSSITSENSRPPTTIASSVSIPGLLITSSNEETTSPTQVVSTIEKSLLTATSSCTSMNPHKSCKRSSSSSNDLLYERDRFRARLRSFNVSFPDHETDDDTCHHHHHLHYERKHHQHQTEPKDGSVPPLNYCACQNEPASLEGDANPCDVCDGIGFKTTKLTMGHPEEVKTLADNFKFEHLTLVQLRQMFDKYFNSELPPTNEMFPWLHGLHDDNFAQRSFFLHQQQQQQQKLGLGMNNVFMDYKTAKPQSSSFLMCVTDGTCPVELHNTVRLFEVLQKIDVSKSEIRDIIALIWKSVDHETLLKGEQLSYIEEEEMIDLLTADCIKLNVVPFFLNLDPDRGISLRNFQIQVAKLSTCSDFVVYGSDSGVLQSIARVLWLAQRDEEQSSGITVPERKVYILDEHLGNAYEQTSTTSLNAPLRSFFHFSKLSSTNLHYQLKDPLLLWDNNFQLREKVETTLMSTATKICQNVYVGNFWDHQIMIHYLQQKKSVTTSETRKSSKPVTPYSSPANSIMSQSNCKSSQDYINLLPRPKSNYKLFLHCHSDASFPDLGELGELLFRYTISSHESQDTDEHHQLSFPPSGSIGIGDCKRDNLRSIVNTCKLIYLYSSSMSPRGLGTLIYCSDGYTESSLLVLCYMMYALNLPLDEVMLQLHCFYERPFYIFNSDVVILRKLEPLLRKYSPLVKQQGGVMNWGEMEEISSAEINEILLGVPKKNSNAKLGYIFNSDEEEEEEEDDDDDSSLSEGDSSSSSEEGEEEDEEDEEDEDAEMKKFAIDWVKEVEGSIPSKILPYLYLGSLKHASCLPLLNKLGIKKVISVGESLPWLNGYKFRKYNDTIVDQDNEDIEIINILPKQRHHHRHRHNSKLHWNTTIDTIMKVNNLEDDGIDELSQQLPKILDFINEEYVKTQGNTKILVHCRVGVSRSATVVIAEIVKRFQVSLPMAYLYVRVRRLNIIIQPNLRFMYELFKWEQELKQARLKNGKEEDNFGSRGEMESSLARYHDGTHYLREIDWFIMCREIMKLNLPYLNN
ncbi:PPS1 [Candida theae]|uniref:PPS1 n=1 Tax=Candida theae TaxID=1198502 RepID=A0AAD5BD29_9ASCO|nr:PPS1 [Candida theae]KAI5956024.1 PPS1 [Candida theae]